MIDKDILLAELTRLFFEYQVRYVSKEGRADLKEEILDLLTKELSPEKQDRTDICS